MKKDLFTSIAVAILGVVISFVICNLFVGDISPVSIKTVDSSFNVEIQEPDQEVFNYRAINPTVEVYVGANESCGYYDSEGNCVYENNQPEAESEQRNQ